jgi:hypothetical protein
VLLFDSKTKPNRIVGRAHASKQFALDIACDGHHDGTTCRNNELELQGL